MVKFYPFHSDAGSYDALADKKEFRVPEQSTRYLEPHQLLLRNYISKHTVYDSILVFHELGSGKTCTAIAIAEGFKEYLQGMSRKVFVLVKNKNIQQNFFNELLSGCAHGEYINDRDLAALTGASGQQRKERIAEVSKKINAFYTFATYGAFVNKVLGQRAVGSTEKRLPPKQRISSLDNTVIIVDEAHNVTNNDVYVALKQVLQKSNNTRLVLLTATPVYDNVKEIFEIANLLNAKELDLQLPIRGDLIKHGLIEKVPSPFIHNTVLKSGITHVTNQGMEALEHAFKGKVSYIGKDASTFPTRISAGKKMIKSRQGSSNVVYCDMSADQFSTYSRAVQLDIKAKTDVPIATTDVPATKATSLYKNSSDASTMTYPGGKFGKEGFLESFTERKGRWIPKDVSMLRVDGNLRTYSCKLYKLVRYLEHSPGPAFVYSNYVSHGGTALVASVLAANGYADYAHVKNAAGPSYVVFDDRMNVETREKLRKVFNSKANARGGIIKVLIGSPVMSEGITLKAVRQVHILEPSWNMSRIEQIVGRAIRNRSHQHLAEEDRTVTVFKYAAVHVNALSQERAVKFFVDREKYILSEEKDRSNKRVERMLKRVAFDCQLPKKQLQKQEEPGTRACDYESCEYVCSYVKPKGMQSGIDPSTFDLYIEFFNKYEIEFVTHFVKELFSRSFVLTLEDIVDRIKSFERNVAVESVYTALSQLVDNKEVITDVYGREGFIVARGPYYVLNNIDSEVASSLYSKTLEFSVPKNVYTLEEYIDKSGEKKSASEKSPLPVREEAHELTPEDVRFNEAVAQHDIYGTFYMRPNKVGDLGRKDDIFRIVDNRRTNVSRTDDKRKVVSGMACASYKKAELMQLAMDVGVDVSSLQQSDKGSLCDAIHRFLEQHNRILR